MRFIPCSKCNDDGRLAEVCRCDDVIDLRNRVNSFTSDVCGSRDVGGKTLDDVILQFLKEYEDRLQRMIKENG